MKRVRKHLTYSNVMSTLAAALALGLGSAYAADKIGSKDIAKDAIHSKQIKRSAVKGVDLAANAVSTSKVLDQSLTAADFAPGQIPKGPPGDPGTPGADATKLFAYSTGGGQLQFGEGATGVEKKGPGTYDVTFDQSLTGCVAMAGIGLGFPTAVASSNFSNDARVMQLTDNIVKVQIRGPGDVATDNAFMVAVFC